MSEDMKKELAASALAGLTSQAEAVSTADETTHGKYDANSCGEPTTCGFVPG